MVRLPMKPTLSFAMRPTRKVTRRWRRRWFLTLSRNREDPAKTEKQACSQDEFRLPLQDRHLRRFLSSYGGQNPRVLGL